MLLSLVAPTLSAAEERYLCVANKATGFSFNKASKSWVQTCFNVDSQKYILTKSKTNKKYVLEFTQIGLKVPMCWSAGFNDNIDFAYFECLGGELKFNKKTGRYLLTQREGYISGDDDFGL